MPDSGNLLSCSFCGSAQNQVRKLIAGPHGYICDGCVRLAREVTAGQRQTAATPIATMVQVSDEAGTDQCSFCEKPRHRVEAMASAGEARICDECLELCEEILSEEPPTIPSR